MRGLLWLIGLFALAAGLAVAGRYNEGYALLVWPPYRIQISLNLLILLLVGAFAAAYLVPLNAHLQDNCEPSNRSTVIAAGNLMDCIMGLVAVGFQLMLRNIFSVQNQFWVLAALGVVITIVAFRLIPREFIRMMGLWIMRIVYRSRIIHQDRIPEDGGAVIVSNHVTYGDALFLSLICPRPIRFIVAEEFVAIRWLGWILELFNCLPISSRNQIGRAHV